MAAAKRRRRDVRRPPEEPRTTHGATKIYDSRGPAPQAQEELPVLRALFVGLLLLLRSTRRASFDKLTNPLNLSREYYWAGWALKCLGLQLLDHIVLVLLDRAYSNKMMMYRINTGNRGLVKLEWIDYLFLCINTVSWSGSSRAM